MILLDGPKYFGTYDFPECLGPYEERMTGAELDMVEAFFGWLRANDLRFGHGNLDSRWRAFASSGFMLPAKPVRNGPRR
jgi:hypothetical protein